MHSMCYQVLTVWLQEDKGSVLIKIHVNPRSSKNDIVGMHEDALAVKITAPALEGKANKAVEEFLADWFGLKKRQVSIVSGDKSRNKTVKLEGISLQKVKEKISGVS